MFRIKTIEYKVWSDGREEESTHFEDTKVRSRAMGMFARSVADETVSFKLGSNYYDWVKYSVQDTETGEFIATATIM